VAAMLYTVRIAGLVAIAVLHGGIGALETGTDGSVGIKKGRVAIERGSGRR
jgi:hypothetical protein